MTKNSHNPQNLYVTHRKDNLKDHSNVKLSIFKRANDTTPQEDATFEELHQLITGGTLKAPTDKVRALRDKKARNTLKARILRAFAVGGTFSYRAEANILVYAGYVHADIDGLTIEQAKALLEELQNDPYTIFCFISPSETGVKVFAKINTTAEYHKTAWQQYNDYLIKTYKIKTDPAPKNVASLCFLCDDTNAFLNLESEVFKVDLNPKQEQSKSDYQLEQLKRDFGFVDIDQPQSLDEFILSETQRIIDGFDPDGSRHPQIAKPKYVFGLLKQYPQSTVSDEVYNMFSDAMGELYSSPAEAKAQNAYKSLSDARERATPIKSDTIEQILKGTPEHRNKYRVYVDEVIPPPQIALRMNGEILGTLGNFSLIIGKAKAKKSFLIAMLCAAALRAKQAENDTITHALPAEQNGVALFDTEMSKYHVQLAARRIHIMAKSPNGAHVFYLRSLPPAERLQFIEAEILSNPRLGLVIIDGIKDLITSINDEEQASMIASWLLRITEQRNIHIVTVLHQNKSDNNARGHIGTELINKAETVLSVSVLEHDSTVSIVEPAQVRNREPQPFAFTIDEDGIPQILEDYETAKPKPEKANNVYSLQDNDLRNIITAVFSNEKQLKYGELQQRVKIAYHERTGVSIGDNKAISIISLCKRHSFIEQKIERGAYTILANVNDDLD